MITYYTKDMMDCGSKVMYYTNNTMNYGS